ncbi:MAG TPA: M56 family metallopeptidase, partial [Pirellulales bacterium]|nr:M56 family metallopeptidase [Pirellulales bacterium]
MLWWTVQTACVATVLTAVVAALCRLGRFSPAVKHALWLLVLVKLLTPPLAWYRLPRVIEGGLAQWAEPAQIDGAEAAEFSGPAAGIVPNDDPLDAEMLDGAPDFVAEQTFFASAEPVEAELIDAVRTRSDESEFGRLAGDASHDDARYLSDHEVANHVAARWLPRAGYLLLAGWLLGAIPLAIIESIRVARLARLIKKQSSPAPAWLERLVGQVAARLGVRPPRVVVTPAACSPLVCAVGRPCLIWPAALGDQLSAEARQVVLLHELAHLRRRDHWVAWLVLAGELLWWFNPLYWYVRHQLRENAELACDAWVVGLLPSGRRTYARALIEVTEFVSLAPAAMPAVAMGNVARHTLERRLIMILRESTSYRVSWAGIGLIGLSLLVVLPSFSGGQDSDPNTGRSAAATLPAGQEPAATPAQPAATQQPAAQSGSALPGQPVAQTSAAS